MYTYYCTFIWERNTTEYNVWYLRIEKTICQIWWTSLPRAHKTDTIEMCIRSIQIEYTCITHDHKYVEYTHSSYLHLIRQLCLKAFYSADVACCRRICIWPKPAQKLLPAKQKSYAHTLRIGLCAYRICMDCSILVDMIGRYFQRLAIYGWCSMHNASRTAK